MWIASPIKRGCAKIIEDILPLFNIAVAVDVPQTITRAYNGLTGEPIPITTQNGTVLLTVPKLECHATVVLEYKSLIRSVIV